MLCDYRTAMAALEALPGHLEIACDLETTALHPRLGKIRLVTFKCQDGPIFTVDAFTLSEGELAYLCQSLCEHPLVIHNAPFEALWFYDAGVTHFERLICTQTLAQVLTAGTPHFYRPSLEWCCRYFLGVDLDKTEQTSNWAGALSEAQLEYAAADVRHLHALLDHLRLRVNAEDLQRVARIECAAIPAWAWLCWSGVHFDRQLWACLTEASVQACRHLEDELNERYVPGGQLPGMEVRHYLWSSPAECSQALASEGVVVESTDDNHLCQIDHHLANTLRALRAQQQLVKMYGPHWPAPAYDAVTERLYPDWRLLGGAAGRTTCTAPNAQQVPRIGGYRRCMKAAPGHVLVKADYSQIELRLAARIAGDRAMLHAYQHGLDLHNLTASAILGVDNPDEAQRQIAKSANFGLLYGMGWRNFRIYALANFGVRLTEDQARDIRNRFFHEYQGLRLWHREVGLDGDKPVATRTLCNRRRLNVWRYTEKLNTPVQGSGADVLKLALGALWTRRQEAPCSFSPVLCVHDEIVLECAQDGAGALAQWLQALMAEAARPVLYPVPAVVDVKIDTAWGRK